MKVTKLLCGGLVILSMFLCSANFSIADPLDNWHWRNPLPPGNNLNGVAYGNGTFVAVGRTPGKGIILTSPDGVSWTIRISGTTNWLIGITYGNGTFVAVGDYGTIVTSPDGVTWTSRTSGTTIPLSEVTYGNGTFVAVGFGVMDAAQGGTILTSPNGVTWTIRISGTPYYNLSGIAYGDGTFVTVGGNGAILSSPDGVSWTVRTSGTSNLLYGVAYGNGTFVAVGENGTILQSDPLTGGPEISVDPTSLNFGDVNLGSTSDKIVTVRNDGNANLIIGTITSPSPPFSKQIDNCSGLTISQNETCTITYRFAPTSAGSFSSNSSIPSNDPDENSVTISLNAGGVAETITIPNILTGPISGTTGVSYSYSTGGSASSLGHSVEYQFDWKGDGTDLSSWGSATQSKSWTSAGTYTVKARTRCATHTSVMSGWSTGLSVTIAGGGIATRDLPDCYIPSVPLSVTITVTPSATTSNYGVVETLPNGWTVSDINENGRWDNINKRVRWFLADKNNRILTYKATPPSGETGTKTFSGTAIFDEDVVTITGDLTIDKCIGETISTPAVPSGPTSGSSGISYSYTTGGSTSNLGHSLEYQFDWKGDGTDLSPWGSATQSKIWTSAGTYNVRARARCATDTSVVSGWSSGLSVIISAPETVSTPSLLSGPTNGNTGTSYTYSTGGSTSSLGHPVQYFFDWGDSTNSGWLPVGTTIASKSWAPAGSYTVKAQARCATDTSVVSNWSSGLSVTITAPTETITTPTTPSGPTSGFTGTSYSYITGGSTSSLGHSVEYQFDWKGDGTDLSSWGSATQSKSWTLSGTYTVKARTRCAVDTSVVSGWSSGLSVTISTGVYTATRDLPDCYTPSVPLSVTITVTPSATTSNYGVVETPPNGWTVSDINENGTWDSISKVVRWFFADKNNRTLTYKATPASSETGSKTFSGRVVFGEDVVTIVGDSTVDRCPETISTPNTPSGPISGITGTSYTYSTGGSISSYSDPVEYQFDWKGDGTDLSSWGATTQSKICTAAGTYNVRARARCAIHTDVISSWSGSLSVNISLAPVPSIVATNPSGLQIIVDGSTYTAPHTFDWIPGSSHNLAVASPQIGTPGTRYVYSSWSDGGTQTHTVTAPSSSTTYTANFTTQYSLTTSVNPPEGGTANPSGTNWYGSGQNVSVSATANPDYSFSNWSGDLSGSTNPASISINRPMNVTANFIQNQYTLTININSPGSGSVTKNPDKATYAHGEQVTLTAIANAGYVFHEWSGDLSEASNPTLIIMNGPKNVTANFTPSAELISTPDIPSGPANGVIVLSYNYATGGSSSNLGHSVQYLFDWGDGTNSGWLAAGTTTALKGWTSPGTYEVKAQARCVDDTFLMSAWSSVLSVTIIQQGVINLPQTGQTKCYDSSGIEINCAGTGQDGESQAGVEWPDRRFTVSGDCVTDNLTGVMWAKNGNLPYGTRTWQGALDFVASLNNGAGLCGYNDWRLPHVNELDSLVNAGEANFATWLIGQGFSNVQSDYYWSSTTDAFYTDHAWVVNMWLGDVYHYYKFFYDSYVWPVRSGKAGTLVPSEIWKTGQTTSYATGDDGDLEKGVAWPSPRFMDYGNGTITDNLTGLMWAKNGNLPDGMRTWQGVLDYVKSINSGAGLGGYHDWRLPNRKELFSLIDHSKFDPALPASHPFQNVQSFPYWSSTTGAGSTDHAWVVNMWNGSVFKDSKSSRYYVWPVRSGQGPLGYPDISVTPNPVSFGNVNVGGTSDQTATIKNDGNANLVVGTITQPSQPFSKIQDNCSGQTIAPNATCTVMYRFAPTTSGNFSSNSNIPSNDPDENPVTVTLNGTGCTAPSITVSKSGAGTGTVTSSPAGINCGDDCSEVYTQGTKVTLTAKADVNSTFTGWSGGGCTGTKTCTVTVDSEITVTASFALKTPDISVARTSLDFGSVKVGKKVTKTLKITNNGSGGLVITLSGLEGTDFSIQGSSSVTIKAKKSYSLKVLFTPKSAGLETAPLMIGSNDPDTPTIEISLNGTGQ